MTHKPIQDARLEAAIRTAIATYHGEKTASAADPDSMMKSAEVREIFDISAMTEWRWRKAGVLPEPIVINGRNYYKRRAIGKVISERQGQSAEAA